MKIIGPDGFEDPQLNDLAGGAQNVNNVYFSTHFSSLPAFSGVTGDISFDALHNAVKPAFLIELNNGVEVNATIVNP